MTVTQAEARGWCIQHLADLLEVPAADIGAQMTFAELGLDSATAVHFVVEIEGWLGIELVPEIVYEYPTVDALAGFLAGGSGTSSDA
jgi:acyl carrier protein